MDEQVVLQEQFGIFAPSQDDVAARTKTIYEAVLARSAHVRSGDFDVIHTDDLQLLYEEYDRLFFGGMLSRRLEALEAALTFRFSKRMTNAAGKTLVRRRLARHPLGPGLDFEIAISSTILYQSFAAGDGAFSAGGVACRDRLEALQRVFEHELVHLLELLVWSSTRCSAPRFQSIAERFFGHRAATHELVTPGARARADFGLRTGSRVTFHFEGRRIEGVVNRITRRATVLVEDAAGLPYSDGRRYRKYYVPLGHLEILS
jgi:hypothetical protein